MDVLGNKKLTEFVGEDWHERDKGRCTHGVAWCTCGKTAGVELQSCCTNPDFTTPGGFQLLADEIEKRDCWYKLAQYLCFVTEIGETTNAASLYFHEHLQPADKSALVLEAYEAGVFGEVEGWQA